MRYANLPVNLLHSLLLSQGGNTSINVILKLMPQVMDVFQKEVQAPLGI